MGDDMPLNTIFSSRFIRFLTVGAFGAACYLIGSYTLTLTGMKAWISSFIVYLLLVPIIYLIQKSFVFKSNASHIKSFPRYAMAQLTGVILSAIVPFAFEVFRITPAVSFVIVAIIITVTNYILQLNWAFSDRHR